MTYEQPPNGKDPILWDIAKKRASFKSHLVTYIVINAFLWTLWYLTGGRDYNRGLPWPVWPALGWGIGLAFHYFGAYVTDGRHAIEKEYQKLETKKNQTS